LLRGARRYLVDSDYTEVTVPHLTLATGSCENLNTLFGLDYWGRKTFLAQTGQLYLETLVDEFEKVYCLGPSFRAEPKVDSRHLTEFPLLEIELVTDLKGLLKEIENLFTSMFKQVLDSKLSQFSHLQLPPYLKYKYSEAVNALNLEWGDDISAENEQKLIRGFGRPLFITHYPKEMKFFNMKADDNPVLDMVKSADLIVPYGGECVGAAEREYQYTQLKQRLINSVMFKQLQKQGKGIEEFSWYLDYYKEKDRMPHAGCGIGLSRVIQYVLKEKDIRHAVTYPTNRERVW